MENILCKKIANSNFFLGKRTWNRMIFYLKVTEETQKGLSDLGFEDNVRVVFGDVSNSIPESSMNELRRLF